MFKILYCLIQHIIFFLPLEHNFKSLIMDYSVCFSSPFTHRNTVRGVAVVTDKYVFAYWSFYSKGHVPTRSDILTKGEFSRSFKSLGDLTSAFMKMNRSITFYDYEEL